MAAFAALHGAYHVLNRRMAMELRDHGLSPSEAVVFDALRRYPQATIAIVRQLTGLRASTLDSLLDRLVARELLLREAPRDLRGEVVLTAAGSAQLMTSYAAAALRTIDEELRVYVAADVIAGMRNRVRRRQSPRRARHGRGPLGRPTGSPSSSRSRARIAVSSAGSAWSQPQTCSVPWVTRRRSSSAGDQRMSPVCPPRPDSACSMARWTETTMSPRCGRRPGGSSKVGVAAPERNTSGGNSGNESTSVGPSWPMWVAFSSASSRSSLRMSEIDAGVGARPPSSARPTVLARALAGTILGTPSRRSTSIRQPPMRCRLTRRCRRLRRSRSAAIRAPRPCSPDTRSACGTCRGAGRRRPRG